MNSFAERLNEALSQKGISQAELSRRTGIGRNSISDYLKAKYEAKQDNLLLLANALDVNEGWLMGLDVEMEKTNITSIYNQLNLDRQKRVINFAKQELIEQNKKVVSYPELNEIHTFAAHRIDETATASPEEKEKLHSKLDEMDRKFDEQQKRLREAEAKRGDSDE